MRDSEWRGRRLRRFGVLLASLLLAVPAASSAAVKVEESGPGPDFQLPSDPETVVVSLKRLRPERHPDGSIRDQWHLRIQADGRVTADSPGPHRRAASWKISMDELRQLLHFILVEEEFGGMPAAPEREPPPPIDIDWIDRGGSTLVLRVVVEGFDHTVHIPPTEVRSAERPTDDILWALQGVAKRTRAGGDEAIYRSLLLTNQRREAVCPDLDAFTLDDFAGADADVEGWSIVYFKRSPSRSQGGRLRSAHAAVKLLPGGEARVSVQGYERTGDPSKVFEQGWRRYCGDERLER